MTPEELRLAFEAEIAKLSDDDRTVWMRFTASGVVQDSVGWPLGSTAWVEWHWLDVQGALGVWWIEQFPNKSVNGGLDYTSDSNHEDVTLKEAAALAIREIRQLFGAMQPPATHQSHRTRSST